MNRLTDMYDSSLMPQIVEHMHTELVKEQDKYILRRLMELDIDKDILINQVAEIKRLNAIIQKDNELEEQGLLLRLPCALGTRVYVIRSCQAPACWLCGGYTYIENCYTKYKSRIFCASFTYAHIPLYGKKVFLTKEEAVKALAERSGE